jgi:hypothetical protein
MLGTQRRWLERVRRLSSLLVFLLVGSTYAPCGIASAGELLILGSTTPTLRPGDVRPSESTIEVPRDAAVTLLASSGGVLRIEGPWQGRIEAADYKGNLIDRLVALFRMPPRDRELGASRAAENCLAVDLDEVHDVCLGPSACIAFEKREPRRERIFLEAPGMKPVEVSSVRDTWPWPKDLPIRPGTYHIGTDLDRSPIELRIHQQPKLPSRAHIIAWMTETGCTEQAQEALSRLSQ